MMIMMVMGLDVRPWWWVCVVGYVAANTAITTPTTLDTTNTTDPDPTTTTNNALTTPTPTPSPETEGNTTYFVSEPKYQHSVPHRAGHYKLKTYPLTTNKWGPEQLLECCRKCEKHDECKSLYVTPEDRTCHLLKLDRCTKPEIILNRTNHHFYERNNKRNTAPPTCYSSCLTKTGSDCNKCGRPSCWGPYCSTCPQYCWDRPDSLAGNKALWAKDQTSFQTWECGARGWQRWWMANLHPPSPRGPNNTPADQPLKLRLEVVYEDQRTLSSNFSSVSVAGGKLTVGNYTGGDAGNWWEAPFQSRSRVFNPKTSNCVAFYYPFTNTDCVANKTKSVAQQFQEYNGTVQEFGLVWTVGDEAYDQTTIVTIKLWVTCANCTGEDP